LIAYENKSTYGVIIMNYKGVFPALFYDPIIMGCGLIIFSASLLTIPFFIRIIHQAFITVCATMLYTVMTCSEYFFPSRKQFERQLKHPQENQNEDKLYLALTVLEKICRHPSKILTALKNDLSCSHSAATTIRYKFKIPFLVAGPIFGILGLIFPSFGNFTGVSQLLEFFTVAGITSPIIAQYGTLFIASALVYSSRTFFIGLGMLLCNGHCLPSPSYQINDDDSPHHHKLKRSTSADSLLLLAQRHNHSKGIRQPQKADTHGGDASPLIQDRKPAAVPRYHPSDLYLRSPPSEKHEDRTRKSTHYVSL
jgi:hypothetical protein